MELLEYYAEIQEELEIPTTSILDITGVAYDHTSENTGAKAIIEKGCVDHEVALMSKGFKAKLTQLFTAWQYISLIKKLGTSEIAWPFYLLKRVTRRFRTQWKSIWRCFSEGKQRTHSASQLSSCH